MVGMAVGDNEEIYMRKPIGINFSLGAGDDGAIFEGICKDRIH